MLRAFGVIQTIATFRAHNIFLNPPPTPVTFIFYHDTERDVFNNAVYSKKEYKEVSKASCSSARFVHAIILKALCIKFWLFDGLILILLVDEKGTVTNIKKDIVR